MHNSLMVSFSEMPDYIYASAGNEDRFRALPVIINSVDSCCRHYFRKAVAAPRDLKTTLPSFAQLVLIALGCSAAFFWWASAQAREKAVAEARRVCQLHQLQLLDQTVGLRKLRWQRDKRGKLCWRRNFTFEYTSGGPNLMSYEDNAAAAHRDHGNVTTLGERVISVDLPFFRDSDGNKIYYQ